MSGSSSSEIFLSYRRDDAAAHVRLLRYELRARMPDARLFVDVDSIETGEDFAEAIYEAIDSCRVLVVLIGPKWATLLDEEGRRRLDDPGDYVRFEVRVALQRGILVIPVLVDGAKPLRHQQLPSDLRQLARLNALELSHTRYDYDVTRLVELIQGTLASASSNVHQSIAMANAEIRAEKSSLRAQFATYPPQLLALWKAQYRARDLMPYRSLAGDAPLLSTLYIEQAVEGKTKEYRSSPRPQSIAEALAIHRHILIIGDPGSGKSTSLYQLAAQAAAWWTGNTSKPILDPSDAPSGLTVPVRVSAQALIGNSLSYAIKKSVMEDLAEYLDLPVLSADIFAQEPLPSIPWLIMIDGIDEILDGARRRIVIDSIARRIMEENQLYRFIVVSRPLPDRDIDALINPALTTFRLKPFDTDQFNAYIMAWFNYRSAQTATADAAEFMKLVERSRIQSLISLPLLGTIALMVYEQDNASQLPRGRAGLYSRFIRYLLHARQATLRGREALTAQLMPYPHGEILAQWIFDHLYSLLEYLAENYLSQYKSPMEDLALSWIDINAPYTASDILERADIRRLLASTGLLIDRGTALAFLHQSFAEYLAAGSISQKISDDPASVRIFIAETLGSSKRSTSLFALGRWCSSEPERDATPIITDLLKGPPEAILLAAEIIAWDIPVKSGIEGAVADSLVRLVREYQLWEAAVVALSALPDRNGALSRIRVLAGDEIFDTSIRIRTARILVDLGDKAASVRILTLMASTDPPLREFTPRVEFDLESNFDYTLRKLQDFEAAWYRWQLGDIDSTDAYYSGYIDTFEEGQPYERQGSSYDDEGVRSDIYDLRYWLRSRGEAAWELADIGEIRTACDLLIALAIDEANSLAHQSDFNGVSGFPIEWSSTDARSGNQILSTIAADPDVSAKIRLSAAVQMSMDPKAAISASSLFRTLAEDDSIDSLIQVAAASELARTREQDLGLQILRRLASGSDVDNNARLSASDQLIALGKIDPGRSGLYALATSTSAEASARIVAAEKLVKYEWTDTGVQILLKIINSDDVDIEFRCEAIHKLAEIDDFEIVAWALESLVQDNSLDPECRIVAAQYLIHVEDSLIGVQVLAEIARDWQLPEEIRIRAQRELEY